MVKNRRSTRRRNGGGYQTSQQFFNPTVLPPTAGMFTPIISSAPTANDVRPVMVSTFQAGAGRSTRRSTRRARGGFSPSVMGSFVANAQAAIVPLALYTVYHTMVPKTGSTTKGGKTRKTRRNRK